MHEGNSITGPQAITIYIGLCFPSSYSWNKGKLSESSALIQELPFFSTIIT